MASSSSSAVAPAAPFQFSAPNPLPALQASAPAAITTIAKASLSSAASPSSSAAPSVKVKEAQSTSAEVQKKLQTPSAPKGAAAASYFEPLGSEYSLLQQLNFFSRLEEPFVLTRRAYFVKRVNPLKLFTPEPAFIQARKQAFGLSQSPEKHTLGTVIASRDNTIRWIFQTLPSGAQDNEKGIKQLPFKSYLFRYLTHEPSSPPKALHIKKTTELFEDVMMTSFVIKEFQLLKRLEQELKIHDVLSQKGFYNGFCRPFSQVVIDSSEPKVYGLIFPRRYACHRPLSLEIRISICKELMTVMEECWKRGVIHNNIKPSNLFYQAPISLVAPIMGVSNDQQESSLVERSIKPPYLKLGDWEMATILDEEAYTHAVPEGSPLFTSSLDLENIRESQEKYRKIKHSPNSSQEYQKRLAEAEGECKEAFMQKDLFAAAVTIYFLLTCHMPYPSANDKHIVLTQGIGNNIKAGWAKKESPKWKENHPIREFIDSLLSLSPIKRLPTKQLFRQWQEALNPIKESDCVIS